MTIYYTDEFQKVCDIEEKASKLMTSAAKLIGDAAELLCEIKVAKDDATVIERAPSSETHELDH